MSTLSWPAVVGVSLVLVTVAVSVGSVTVNNVDWLSNARRHGNGQNVTDGGFVLADIDLARCQLRCLLVARTSLVSTVSFLVDELIGLVLSNGQ